MSSGGRRGGPRGGVGGRPRGGRGRGRGSKPSSTSNNKQSDEEVLIEFMPYMRSEHPDALLIHQKYAGIDERLFLQAARDFLEHRCLSRDLDKLKVEDDPVVATSAARATNPNPISPPRTPVPPAIDTSNHNNIHLASSPMPPGFQLPGIGLHTSQPKQSPHTTPRPEQASTPMGGGIMQPNYFSQTPQPIGTPRQPVPSPSSPMAQISSSVGLPSLTSVQPPSALKPNTPGLQQRNSPAGGSWQPSTPGLTSSLTLGPPTPATDLKPKSIHQPKRLWTRTEEQPGRIFANNVGVDGPMLDLCPRQELSARWILPLKYLRERMASKSDNGAQVTIRDALQDLGVGLFRRGCTENGSNASIISKEILSLPTENRNDYPFQVDHRADLIVGTVPFYAPRTPGHVLFRLYWQDEPLYTLATGPTLNVRVREDDFESTLRFILSNFKSRKGSATSLSSLNALSTVLEQFQPVTRLSGWDSAGRAAWGCICESRKVLELCAAEYVKGKAKFAVLEEEVKELKQQAEQEEIGDEEGIDEDEGSSADTKLKEKTQSLIGGRASNERRWKDSQVAFATILKAVLSNSHSSLLFRRELISKISLEYELWCPLTEAFAPSPFNSDSESLCVDFNEFPQHVTVQHLRQCVESRNNMQEQTLGFIPNKKTLQEALFKGDQGQGMDRTVVGEFNSLSAAMGKLYEEQYLVADRILQQREMVRSHLENIVQQCDAFPPGTRVMVFGSSANGFGSPSSDLDMCLQLPPDIKMPNDQDDPTGALAMGQLAQLLEHIGMKNVDTVRLTARIPIIMFNCPRPMAQEGEEPLMECDLSFMNPLAVLNTSLLLSYSRVHPVTRVLAAIIKRWAKARNINNPSKHTLSSYGYILMLIHFLTYHVRAGNGLIASVETSDNGHTKSPLLPNLQWMDPTWLKMTHAPYTELAKLPLQLVKHPLEDNQVVNAYFFRGDSREWMELQSRFPSQDLSLAILLASFFRYYAYEFDYKQHVVSLQSRLSSPKMEREIKAEVDGWKVYSTGLAIEDPFETFYDVAHVLKGGNFHRLRNELALAYTKIIEAVETPGSPSGIDLIDLLCEPVTENQED